MAKGGNARDRRKIRRVVESILEAYGYSLSEGARASSPKTLSIWDLVLRYIGPIVGLTGFGYKLTTDGHVWLALVLNVFALAILLSGIRLLQSSRWKRVIRGFLAVGAVILLAYCEYHWIRESVTPTFLYIVPTHDLVDCERRAFFVNHSGLKDLQNVEIVIKDNASGTVQKESYPDVEPGPQNPDAPRYIWVKPSRPWDEGYTITITANKFHSVQETKLRSSKGQAQFAAQVTVDEKKKPVLRCRDALLPESYVLARGSRESCDKVMAIDPGLLNKLQPEVYGLQRPNGDYTVVRVRRLPEPSDLDSLSEDRHLIEYQLAIMRSKLSGYRGTKLLIVYAGGPKTLAYAKEFRDLFYSLRWIVDGPRFVPIGNERMVDVQVSISSHYWNRRDPVAEDLLSGLEGVKHRQRPVLDSEISPEAIVLWVGPKSPSNFRPDDCAPAELHPQPGEHHTCEMVVQSTSTCPFPPQ